MKIKNIFKILLPALFVALFTCTSCTVLSFSSSYQLDHLFYEMNGANQTYYKDAINNYVEIRANDKKQSFNNLFYTFYYNLLPYQVRYLHDESFLDNDDNKLTLFTQPTFSISDDLLPDGGHYIDYGVFSAYYSSELLGPRGYLEKRFDSEAFVFISDTYADVLLNKYNIESYNDLILKEEYCLLDLRCEDGKIIKACINDIIYSDKRQGERTKDLYPYFALFGDYIGEPRSFNFRFEIDFKTNTYGQTRIMSTVNNLGFNKSNATFNFMTFDKSDNAYHENEYINSKFISISGSDALFIVLYALISIASIFTLIFSFMGLKNEKEKLIALILTISLFIVYGLIANFIYLYYLFSIVPLTSTIVALIMCRKEVKNVVGSFFNKVFKNKNNKNMEREHNIKI